MAVWVGWHGAKIEFEPAKTAEGVLDPPSRFFCSKGYRDCSSLTMTLHWPGSTMASGSADPAVARLLYMHMCMV